MTEISWRATRLITRDGAVQMVPNGLIAGHRLVNYGGAEGGYRVSLRVPLDPALPRVRAKGVLLAGGLDAGRRRGARIGQVDAAAPTPPGFIRCGHSSGVRTPACG